MKATIIIAVIALLAFLSGCTALEDADIMKGGQQSLRPIGPDGGTLPNQPPKEEPTNPCRDPDSGSCFQFCKNNPNSGICQRTCENNPKSAGCTEYCRANPETVTCQKTCESNSDPSDPFGTDACALHCSNQGASKTCMQTCTTAPGSIACGITCEAVWSDLGEDYYNENFSELCGGACTTHPESLACDWHCRLNPEAEECSQSSQNLRG